MNSYTEEQANEKWCPATRQPMVGGTVQNMLTCNRDQGGGPHGRCIASLCMWWLWDEASAAKRPARLQEDKIAAEREGPIVTRGYCGAARS